MVARVGAADGHKTGSPILFDLLGVAGEYLFLRTHVTSIGNGLPPPLDAPES